MNLNDDVVYRCGRLGSLHSFIPAVPAAWSVTTIAFIGITSCKVDPGVRAICLVMARLQSKSGLRRDDLLRVAGARMSLAQLLAVLIMYLSVQYDTKKIADLHRRLETL